ncbi:hypothetical protein [Bradyrhizobium sp. NBAIM03]|uniref:outer membrane protein n=1 Tax=Bradyrhizobium sp. NBAIM03 TaxID=2793816 RepID=UPI0032088062
MGGHIGYRWQIANSVFGLETQGNWADFKGSNANLAFAGVRDDSTLDAFGLFTGQVGYAWNNVLLYVRGGAAVVRDKYRVSDFATGLTIGNGSEIRWGGTVGAALNLALLRTGPSELNTTTCSWVVGMWISFFHPDSWVFRWALLQRLPVSVRTSITAWSV